MAHRREQKGSGKPKTWIGASERRSWGSGLLGLLGACVLLGMSMTPAQGAGIAYITNSRGNTLSVINVATNTVLATVPVGSGPTGVAVNPAGTRVYVANKQDSLISVLDTATNSIIATVQIGVTSFGVAVNPAGTRVYITSPSANTVLVLDTATHTVLATVPVGPGPTGVAVNPAGTRVYVANTGSNTISVLDTATNTVLTTVKLGQFGPVGVAINPAGSRVYVAEGGGEISVLDTATNTVLAAVSLQGTEPQGVAVNATGSRVYVAKGASYDVSVLDTATNRIIATVPVGVFPIAFGQFIAPLQSPPQLVLTLTGCTTCRMGDRLTVQAHVTNADTTTVQMEVKVGVRLPNGTPANLLGEFLKVPLPGGLDTTVTVFDSPLPAGLPQGSWTFEGALLEPELGGTLSRSVVPFTVIP